MGVSGWFDDDSGSASGSGLGMVPGQVNKGKMRGKGAFGYGGAEVIEVDPVSIIRPGSLSCHQLINKNVIDWDRQTIKGTSTKLEKSYLRLTSVSRHDLE